MEILSVRIPGLGRVWADNRVTPSIVPFLWESQRRAPFTCEGRPAWRMSCSDSIPLRIGRSEARICRRCGGSPHISGGGNCLFCLKPGCYVPFVSSEGGGSLALLDAVEFMRRSLSSPACSTCTAALPRLQKAPSNHGCGCWVRRMWACAVLGHGMEARPPLRGKHGTWLSNWAFPSQPCLSYCLAYR